MKDNFKMEWDKVIDYSYGQVEINMMANGSIILDTDRVYYKCKMEINMTVNGKKTGMMEMEIINGLMEINITDNGKIIKELEKELFIGINIFINFNSI